MASIIGPKYLEKVRSSDYKNSTYAIAEIIDNSVDAGAKNIELISITKNNNITDIYFIDDGKGMDKKILEKCVIFSESTNTPGNKKTGSFGMGLPNSSLAICKEFSVITQIDGIWMSNTVDIDKMMSIDSLEVSPIEILDTNTVKEILNYSKIENPKTIIKWSKIDRLDFVKADTLKNRSSKLLGRILRHKISEGLKIEILNFSDGNTSPSFNEIVLENDPLYLTKNKSWIAHLVQKEAEKPDSNTIAQFNTNEYFKKFFISKNLTHPLFHVLEDAGGDIEINWYDKKYTVNIKVAIAYRDIQKPGTREGGNTEVGKEFGKKVKGDRSYPSGNISWIRNGREIQSGNYSLFNVGEPNQRFWSIEIKYETTNDNNLDRLLGLSNSKQSLKFFATDEMPEDTGINAHENNKKIELWCKITKLLKLSIKKAQERLKKQASAWATIEKSINGSGSGNPIPGGSPKTYNILLKALGKGANLGTKEIDDLTTKINDYLPQIQKSSVREGVLQYSKIGLKTIIIYCELNEYDLFQFDSYRGINITLININHRFYIQVISPLKKNNSDDILASIELLICSMTDTVKSYDEEQTSILKRFFHDNSLKLIDFLKQNDPV